MKSQLTNQDLKRFWKYTCPKGRFGYDTNDDGLVEVIDNKYGMLICPGNGKRWEAIKCAWFAKNYVRINGDIDFRSFPYYFGQSLFYDGDKPEIINDNYLNEFDKEQVIA